MEGQNFDYDAKAFSYRVARHRVRLGLTQATLAKTTDIDATVISRLENGTRTPSIRHLCRLATALGVSVDYLLGRDV